MYTNQEKKGIKRKNIYTYIRHTGIFTKPNKKSKRKREGFLPRNKEQGDAKYTIELREEGDGESGGGIINGNLMDKIPGGKGDLTVMQELECGVDHGAGDSGVEERLMAIDRCGEKVL